MKGPWLPEGEHAMGRVGAATAAAGVCTTSTPGDIKEAMAPLAPRQRRGEMPFQFRHASEFAKKNPLLINLRLKL